MFAYGDPGTMACPQGEGSVSTPVRRRALFVWGTYPTAVT
jgi:hypothetical protein